MQWLLSCIFLLLSRFSILGEMIGNIQLNKQVDTTVISAGCHVGIRLVNKKDNKICDNGYIQVNNIKILLLSRQKKINDI